MRHLIALCLAALALNAVAAPAKPKPVAETPPTGPLPRTVLPQQYDLRLKIDPAQEGFEGEVNIRVQLTKAARQLWLHGKDLEMLDAAVLPAQGDAIPAIYKQVNSDGLAQLSWDKALAPQTLTLRLRYRAKFNQQLEGLYKNTLGGAAYAMTQMEPVSARLAFPSFDEPSFKTPFDLQLTVPQALVAVANSAQSGEVAADGWKTLSFATTPPLPTYLVAFAVGPWDVVEGAPIPANELRANPVPLRALGPKGSAAKLLYALNNTAEAFTALERYFGQPYPFGKLDLLAAPDFSAGAMENAGLITYRDSLLLLDPSSPVRARQTFYSVHIHEMAHQWFGDLVTMTWWDDLWLNEAFATWMATKITGQLRPEFHTDLSRLSATLAVMAEDSLTTARRIRNPIHHNGDIEQAFDGITYDKGAAVLSMFEHWIGAEAFRDGIRQYMQAHLRGNASSDDLVRALAASSGKGLVLERALRSFLNQPGIPALAVDSSCKNDALKVTLKQSRYLPIGSKGDPRARWELPVCFKYAAAGSEPQEQCVLMDQPAQSFNLDAPACPAWLLPNAGAAGYYRFSLSPAAFAALSAQLPQLPPAEQMVAADAVSASFKRGTLNAPQLLDAMAPLATSSQQYVATALLGDFEWIRENLASETVTGALSRYAAALYAPKLQEIGPARRAGEDPDSALLRRALYGSLAVNARVPEFRAPLLKAGSEMLAASSTDALALDLLDQDLLGPVLSVLGQEQGGPLLERYMGEAARSNRAIQRQALLGAIAISTQPDLGERVRDFGLSEQVKTGELSYFYPTHFSQPENFSAAWAWAQKNYPALQQRIPVFARSYLPEMISAGWCDEARSSELQNYFKPQLAAVPGMDRTLLSAREAITLCSALKKQQAAPALEAWAAEH